MEENKIKSNCYHCNRDTNHEVMKCYTEYETFFDDFNTGDHEEWRRNHDHEVIKCLGCDLISYRYTEYQVYYKNHTTGEIVEETRDIIHQEFYPEVNTNDYSGELYGSVVPWRLVQIYKEVINAYNKRLNLLCAAGLRAIVEGICKNKGAKGKTLMDKVRDLNISGLINLEITESLKAHNFLGNYALHRLDNPSSQELLKAIHLIEDAINSLYLVPQRHSELKSLITKRVSESD